MTTASHGLLSTLLHLVLPAILLSAIFLGTGRALFPGRLSHFLRQCTRGRVALALSLVILALYGSMAALRLYFPGFIDPGEPLISAISFFALHGRPVYANLVPYGPFCYLPYAVLLRLFPPHVLSLKLLVLVADVALMLLLFRLYRLRLRLAGALLTTALVIAALLMKQSYLLQIRGDIFILIAVALALSAALARGRAAWLVFSVALALGAGIKVTAVLYLLAPGVLFLQRHGMKRLLAAAGLAGLLNFAPFALPALSLSSYLFWLSHMSHELRSMKEFAGNLFTTAVLVLPGALLYRRMASTDPGSARRYLRERGAVLGAFLASVLVMDAVAAKVGGGRHHLAPFFIMAGFLAADMFAWPRDVPASRKDTLSLLNVWAWSALGILLVSAAAGELQGLWRQARVERPQAIALAQDVEAILARFPGQQIQLGAGTGTEDLDRTYSPQYAAPALVFKGNPYNFDTSAAADSELLQLQFPSSSLRDISSCETAVWLIPKGQAPFATRSIYSSMYPKEYPGHILFSQQIRESFLRDRTRIGSSRFFDLYACRGDNAAGRASGGVPSLHPARLLRAVPVPPAAWPAAPEPGSAGR